MSKLKGCTENPTEFIMTHIHSKMIKNIEHALWTTGIILKIGRKEEMRARKLESAFMD